MKAVVTLALSILIVAGGVAAWFLSRSENYAGPPRTQDLVHVEPSTSTLTLPIAASLDVLQAQLESALPQTLASIDQGQDACVPAQYAKVCVLPRPWGGCAQWLETKTTPDIDCHVTGAATRGPVGVGGSGNRIDITMPVHARVTVRGRGEIGRHIRETATGSIQAAASAKLDLQSDWTPSADVAIDYSWTNRIGVDVLGIRITFASQVDPEIRRAIERAKQDLPGLLAQIKLRDEVERAWTQGFTTVRMDDELDLWLRIEPLAAGFAGYQIDGRTLRTQLLLSARTEVVLGTAPTPIEPRPLPPLVSDLPPPGFMISVPLRADYSAMALAAREAMKVGEIQTFEVPTIGPVEIVIRDIVLHQTTGRRLAVGLMLEARPDSSWLETSGHVWMVGSVDIDQEARRVSASSFDVWTHTDNRPIDLLVQILRQTPLLDRLRKSLAYDYTTDHEQALANLNAALNRPISDIVAISGSVKDASIGQVVAGPDAIWLALQIQGVASMSIQSAAAAQ